ncbi:MAG: TfoX/Sxy family protein [Verrucomicrobia bacterium]|nr:TfoX/Sxy family protein [Verrucomicrobiota bacterium]
MDLKTRRFQELIEEQLLSLAGLSFRRLFSGFGLYADDIVFGLIHGEKLYFYTNDVTRLKYQKLRCTVFSTPGSKKAMKRYWEVPASIIENQRMLVDWALEAIQARRTEK